MNFIGPRPEIPEFVDPENPLQRELSQVRPGLLDSATLHWLDEAEILGAVPDWKLYYRKVVLPDKCARSLADIHAKSVSRDLRLFLQAIVLLFRRSPARSRSTPCCTSPAAGNSHSPTHTEASTSAESELPCCVNASSEAGRDDGTPWGEET